MRRELDRKLKRLEARSCVAFEPETFRAYVSRVMPSYRWYRHCDVLAGLLQQVADGEIKRLMVFMPPRHGKSQLVSRLFPAYFLLRYPERWVAVTSYGAELAYTLSRAAREFYTAGGGHVSGGAAAVKHWETGRGGGLWAAGVGGPATGKGFHVGIIDDPLKNYEEAASEVIREKQKEWYGATWSTREEPWGPDDPVGAEIIVQTRWHEHDLSGWRLQEERDAAEALSQGDPEAQAERWRILTLPAIAEGTEEEGRGEREEGRDHAASRSFSVPSSRFPPTCTVEPDWRAPGEALCPERRPIYVLRRIEQRIGSHFFAALYQQRPTPRGGDFFRREWFAVLDALPADGMQRVRYWDKAGAAPRKGDWTVGLLMARTRDGIYYVEDVVRGQWPADARNAIIQQTAQMDQERGHVRIGVEQPPGLAKESTEAVVRMLAGFSVFADPVSRDKAERAEPLAAQAMAGNVKLLRGSWNRAFLDELEVFPHGAHDDQVDAASGAFNALAGRQPLYVGGAKRQAFAAAPPQGQAPAATDVEGRVVPARKS